MHLLSSPTTKGTSSLGAHCILSPKQQFRLMLVRSHFLFKSGILLRLRLHLAVKTETKRNFNLIACSNTFFHLRKWPFADRGGSSAYTTPWLWSCVPQGRRQTGRGRQAMGPLFLIQGDIMAFGPSLHTDTGFTLLWQKHARMHQNPPLETEWNPNIFSGVGYTLPHPTPLLPLPSVPQFSPHLGHPPLSLPNKTPTYWTASGIFNGGGHWTMPSLTWMQKGFEQALWHFTHCDA